MKPDTQNCTFKNTCDRDCHFRVEWDGGSSKFVVPPGEEHEYPVGPPSNNPRYCWSTEAGLDSCENGTPIKAGGYYVSCDES